MKMGAGEAKMGSVDALIVNTTEREPQLCRLLWELEAI